MRVARIVPLVPGIARIRDTPRPVRSMPRAMSEDEPRMKLILELRGKKESLRSIGRKVNLSYERVRVLLAREQRRQAEREKEGVAG